MYWGKRYATVLLLLFMYVVGTGQTPTPVPDLKNITFSSPNVSNMLKFGNIPIGLATGTPNISVPFYTMKVGDISLPITLNYHASGIKVSEDASWAGLGWNLAMGGNITREVRGLPDESLYGYLSTGAQLATYLTGGAYPFVSGGFLTAASTSSTGLQDLDNIMQGVDDSQADLFHYSCGNYSGNFFFNQAGNIVQVPEQNVVIQFNGQGEGSSAFTITTPEGLIYHYGTIHELVSGNNSNTPYTSCWFLTEIDDQYQNKVSFNYTQYWYYAWNFGSETKGVLSSNNILNANDITPAPFENTNYVYNSTATAVVSSIQTKNENIVFYAASNRQDIPGEYTLDSVKVFSAFTGQVVRQLDLYTSYMGSPGNIGGYTPNTTLRLRLDSLLIDSVEKYKFAYDPTALPYRMSLDQDMWGYYNAAGNTSMAPNYVEWTTPSTWIYIEGGNRLPNPQTVTAGSLTQITYPTGGTTTFTYEPNTISTPVSTLMPYENPMQDESVGNYTSTQVTQGVNYSQPIDYALGSTPITFDFINLATSGSSFNWSVQFIDSATMGMTVNLTVTDGEVLTPLAGTYYLKYTITGGKGTQSDPAQTYGLYATWSIPTYGYTASTNGALINQMVGGIRIKEMDDYDPVGNLTNVHTYDYSQADGVNSSGQVVDLPILNRIAPYDISMGLGSDDGCVFQTDQANMQLLTSYSQVPVAINSSELIGYSRVTESEGLGARLQKRVYQYTNVSDYGDIKILPQYDFPATPYSSQYFNRGLLLDQMDYEQVAGSFQPIKETKNYYNGVNTFGVQNFCTNSVISVQSPVVYVAPGSQCGAQWIAQQQQLNISWSVYEIISGFNHLDSTAEIDYDQRDPNNFRRTVTAFTWTNPLTTSYALHVPRTKTFVNSKGESMVSNYTYAFDLAGATAATTADNGINNLLNRSLYTRLVESSMYKNIGGTQTFLRAGLYNYDPVSPEITQQFAIENAESGGFTSFQPVSVVSGQIQQDPNYLLRQSNDLYDGFGNLLQKHRAYDNLHSYIWDYHASFPVAEAVNAGQSDIAYCGFEADGTGNWTFSGSGTYNAQAFAGTYDYNMGQGSVSRSGLNTGTTYVVSYWSQGGPCIVSGSTGSPLQGKTINGWTYYEHQVSGQGSVTVSGTATVDELRLYPAGAQMTTYSYLPSVGISESCDVGNRETHYQYDHASRLAVVKDQDGNIIKTYNYNYVNQPQ